MLSSTQGVCYPNKKKGGLQLSANARWLFRNPVSGGHCCSLAGTTQRAGASRERGFSSLIKKLFLTQSVYSYQSITLQAARDWPQNPQKEFYLIKQWIWIFFFSLSLSVNFFPIWIKPHYLSTQAFGVLLLPWKTKVQPISSGQLCQVPLASPSVGSMVTAYTLLWALEWFWCNIVFIYF